MKFSRNEQITCRLGDIASIDGRSIGQGIATGSEHIVEGYERESPDRPLLLRLVGIDQPYGDWRFVRSADYVKPRTPPEDPEPTKEELARFEAAKRRLAKGTR
jgi:hypothetical protein